MIEKDVSDKMMLDEYKNLRELAKETLYNNMSESTHNHINKICYLETWIIEAMIEFNSKIINLDKKSHKNG